ncbi:acyl-CoA dehydrogenase family protein [Streptomyces radicis]|uniref:Uncharacterized protein n=1 Tax=Streptomyces radicis TaxID=1750517 RepID=A0A3A9WCT9_9ACTN|nr:acyl-CoA dehydrogenase family protein [Streptomyces radicis]RKN10908.1 hypothetical protein D7319_07115 [Streptomyces radicis]RKN25171.1 hypothetical protein D7318_07970 [Streptomyces radicis]
MNAPPPPNAPPAPNAPHPDADLHDLARRHAAEADRTARLPEPVRAALLRSDVISLPVPAAYGGPETDPVASFARVAALAAADASTAWYAAVSASAALTAWSLPPEAAHKIWGRGPVLVAGTRRVGGLATADGAGGGVILTEGRWQWGSAARDADWITVGARDDTGRELLLTVERAAFHVNDDWQAIGLRATASGTFRLAGPVRVPAALCRPLDDAAAPAHRPGPLGRFAAPAYTSGLFCAVALGNARGAVEEFEERARTTRRLATDATLAATDHVRRAHARALVACEAAEALALRTLADAWDDTVRGRALAPVAAARTRAALAHATEVARDTVDACLRLVGSSGVRLDSPLQRRQRDATVLTAHHYLGERHIADYGRARLHPTEEPDA